MESATTFVDAPPDLRSVCLALLAGLVLFHSIRDSLITFGALHAGAPFGYGDWLAWFWYAVPLNIAGGLVVVTFLRLVRSKELLQRERAVAAAER